MIKPKVYIKDGKIRIDPEIERKLRNAQYGVWGHSTVEICHWTKKALKKEGVCYKRKFFGIETHRCMEFSPAGVFCQNRCIYCWRPSEFYSILKMDESMVDDPKEIVEHLMEERRKLLSGFGGNEKVDKQLFKESLNPSHFAISLSGEPTMYPKIDVLVKEYKKHGMITFLVTNGMQPERLLRINADQLYISFESYNRKLYERLNVPLYKDGWERLMKSLRYFRDNRSKRRVMRITLIKDWNMKAEKFKEFIDIAEPDFIETKAYMYIGYSRERMKFENMPTHREVVSFSKELSDITGYRIKDEEPKSRVVLLER